MNNSNKTQIAKAFICLAYAAMLTWADSSAAAGPSSTANSQSSSSIDSLGGNPELVRRAKYLSPTNKTQIVQKREVDRDWRIELGLGYGMVGGGDSYVNSHAFAGNLDLHINPRWSIGVRYDDYTSALNSEGQNAQNNANQFPNSYAIPAIDYPLNSTVGVLCFYPLYGKLNMFDLGVAQFDVYMLGGGGQMVLNDGSTSTWTAGGGVGIWLSQHFTTRLEVRYNGYTNQNYPGGARSENNVLSTLSIGFML